MTTVTAPNLTTIPERTMTPDEVCDRGREIYETRLREQMEPENFGRLLVIDVETGEYEFAPPMSELAEWLHAKGPSTTRYMMRIGYPAVIQYGGGSLRPLPRYRTND